ncbi:MAG TPA: TetR/AcrR family transcriptional regulator [Beutenbergiaceae bacterium]|nr:TetR/AcrR family transcriptional regulator [Beutenbergiaceae bacterium]
MPRPRRYDEELRRRLLEVASEAISKQGPQGVSLRAIAGRAGTTTAAVYALFGGREQLIEAVAAEGFTRFGAHLDATPRTADPSADLLTLGLTYRTSALADPHFYRVMFSGTVTVPAADSAPTFSTLRDAVRRLVGGPADIVEQRSYQLWSLVHGLVDLELGGYLPGDGAERAERYRQTLNALGPALLGQPPSDG